MSQLPAKNWQSWKVMHDREGAIGLRVSSAKTIAKVVSNETNWVTELLINLNA